MFKYDALVYIGLAAFFLALVVGGFVLRATSEAVDLEIRKLRFAAATFTGILLLFVFAAILYFVDPAGPGKEIFDKSFTAMSPLAGALVGYYFAAKK